MQKEDYFIFLFIAILAIGLIYFYQNIESFNCFVENSTQNVMSDIKYEFEPEGSLYGKVKIYRFNILSSKKDLEYYGMKITNGNGDVLFSDIETSPEGGSIVATLLVNETDVINVNRFFKKKCYAEVKL